MILTILRILFLRLRNNPLELLLVFVMPVVFFTIFAAIFSNGIATGSDKKLRVGWITGRERTLGFELQAFLETNSLLQCDSLVSRLSQVDAEDDLEEEFIDDATVDAKIADAQRSGRYDLIIRLPMDFPATLADAEDAAACRVQLVTDGQNPMAVAMVTSVVKGFFAQKKASLLAEQSINLDSANKRFNAFRGSGEGNPPLEKLLENRLPPSPPPRGVRYFDPVKEPSQIFENDSISQWLITDADGVISVNGVSGIPKEWSIAPAISHQTTAELLETVLAQKSVSEIDDAVSISVENPQSETQENPRIAMYAAGIAVLFLLFSSTGNAAALLEEAESGTLDRILVSQAGLFQIISGKWLGIFLLGCLQICVMYLWAELIFRIQLWNHLDGFVVMTVCTAAAAASFAMLMATLCKSRAQLNAVSVVIILSMSAVGGSMIPRFVMSDRMKEIGKWTFNAWALDGYQKVFWYQSPVSSLQTEVTLLLGSALVLGVLALIFSRRWKQG
jgi:ABC-2 type transport system permease protein